MNLYDLLYLFPRAFNKLIIVPIKLASLGKHGKNVHFGRHVRFYGINNVYIGDDVSLGENNILMCTKAKINIGNHVMTAPYVTMITGGHRIDIKGRPITTIRDEEKLPENDKDINLNGDNWIGEGAIILKGVTIGEGGGSGSRCCCYIRCTTLYCSCWSTSKSYKKKVLNYYH